jgi:catalase
MSSRSTPSDGGSKELDLERDRTRPESSLLTTDQGALVSHTDDSLKAGPRGPTLLEDFHLREKLTRFDHERIPERVVHARGSGAHGVFKVYESLSDLTIADFLCDPALETPVFVRFSTVQGSRGSADTVRDVRGFATKFYTRQGNFDLVGNSFPVFFVQDGIKFPDLIHALKPEPTHDMPQGASAHDSFWDFVSLVPESAHMVMWLMSDRALPRSYAMMEGFGVHTFRLVDAKGESRFVKFHWKPLLGLHSLTWDEAQKIAGKDPDFHRRDLWDSIEAGIFPEFELGLQLVDEATAADIGVDLLDATKLVPEEVAPVRRVGRMTLNRNPDDFFAETEQVAFDVANVVPGIGFTNDPVLQARLFSYRDTQLTRLGGPNHASLPINRPLAAVHNHQRGGYAQHAIAVTRANYLPNSIGGGCPMTAMRGGYTHFPEPAQGQKTRERPETFADCFTQAAMFFHSMSKAEKEHIADAFRYELGRVERKEVRQRFVTDVLAKIDGALAAAVASSIGVTPPSDQASTRPRVISPALSMAYTAKKSIRGRRVAILAAAEVEVAQLSGVASALTNAGATPVVVSLALGPVVTQGKSAIEATTTFLTASSVLFDAVFVPGGARSVAALRAALECEPFVRDAYRHAKPIGGMGEGIDLVEGALAAELPAGAPTDQARAGLVLSRDGDIETFTRGFTAAIARHRFWERSERVPQRR